MGMFDQFKAASEMMKNMDPNQLKDLMKQAEASKKMMEDMVRQVIADEVKSGRLVTRDEVERLIREAKNS
ncbi:MAG: hypothetical protein KGZ30_02080 [Anaplasmataceae bacterium]|nr:hypothetical protein [Anaplasmataceae bacterium]